MTQTRSLNGWINNDRGQSLISKYVWVIETISRRKKISFKELNEKWLRDTDISRGVELPKRTFDNWRYVIWDMFGINIANENCGEYRYYIENKEDLSNDGLRSWLYNTFCESEHQRPNPAGVCAVGSGIPAAHHQCHEGQPRLEHPLS